MILRGLVGGLVLGVVLTFSTSSFAQGFHFTLPTGLFRSCGDDEICLEEITVSDPVKIRLAVREDLVESNLGALSWNKLRRDGRGTHDEYGYLMGRLTADKQAGAMYVALRPRGQESSREVLYIDTNVAIFRVPVIAPNLGGGGGSFLTSGAYQLHLQSSDGNTVLYEIVDSAPCPRWAMSWIGSYFRGGVGWVDRSVLAAPCNAPSNNTIYP